MVWGEGNTVFYNSFEWYFGCMKRLERLATTEWVVQEFLCPETNCDTPAKYKLIVAIRGTRPSPLHILQADSRASNSACNHGHSYLRRVWGAHFLNRIIFIHIAKFFIKLFWQHIGTMMIEFFFFNISYYIITIYV